MPGAKWRWLAGHRSALKVGRFALLGLALVVSAMACAQRPAARSVQSENGTTSSVPVAPTSKAGVQDGTAPERPVSVVSTGAAPFDLRAANYAFAARVYRELSRQPGNFVFSPASIQLSIALSYTGAWGRTQLEMADAANLPADVQATAAAVALQLAEWKRFAVPDKLLQAENRFAAALFHDNDVRLLDSFQALARDRYGASIDAADFSNIPAARQAMNAWAERATDGRITGLLRDEDLASDEGLTAGIILLNALFFKARWKDPFYFVRPGRFHLDDGRTVQAQMMSRHQPSRHAVHPEVRVLELEYETEGYSLLILLPDEPGPLSTLEARLDGDRILAWTAFLPRNIVEVTLPAYKIGPTIHHLKPLLQQLGMRAAFERNVADFSRTTQRRMFIEDVHHGAFIEVDRYGTTAAAATAEVRLQVNARRPTFMVDRPFLFLLRDNRSGLILFMGRLTNPTV